jgi:hypothetical protein
MVSASLGRSHENLPGPLALGHMTRAVCARFSFILNARSSSGDQLPGAIERAAFPRKRPAATPAAGSCAAVIRLPLFCWRERALQPSRALPSKGRSPV